MIDAHAHLDDAKYGPGEAEQALQRASEAGVEAIVMAAVDLDSARALLAIAETHDNLYVAVGFHPHEASKLQTEQLDEMRSLSEHPKVVAIGEIGLDYHYENSPRDTQKAAIRQQLALARELDLPVVVHNRESEEDMYPILRDSGAQGILHCFSGNLEEARRYVAAGFHLSIACTVTYPNAAHTREVVQHIPLDRLLTETDSPYLPPQSLRGKRNEPAHVSAVVAKIAELKGLSEAEVSAQTARNAATLFRLPLQVRS